MLDAVARFESNSPEPFLNTSPASPAPTRLTQRSTSSPPAILFAGRPFPSPPSDLKTISA